MRTTVKQTRKDGLSTSVFSSFARKFPRNFLPPWSAHICVTFALFADKRARANELVRLLSLGFWLGCSTLTASSRCSYRIDYYSYRMKHGRCGECSCKWFLTNGPRSRERKRFPARSTLAVNSAPRLPRESPTRLHVWTRRAVDVHVPARDERLSFQAVSGIRELLVRVCCQAVRFGGACAK